MNAGIFYSHNVKQRLKLVEASGEFISRIKYYGFYIDLHILDKSFVEVYYNRYTNKVEQVEIMDPEDERMHLYAVHVNLSDLFKA